MLEIYAMSTPRSMFRETMLFRLKYKKQKLSYFDALGYIFARRKKILFATGDKEFKKLSGVEYRK